MPVDGGYTLLTGIFYQVQPVSIVSILNSSRKILCDLLLLIYVTKGRSFTMNVELKMINGGG